MFQPIQTLPIPGTALSKLLEIGFLYCEDLWSNEESEMLSECNFPKCSQQTDAIDMFHPMQDTDPATGGVHSRKHCDVLQGAGRLPRGRSPPAEYHRTVRGARLWQDPDVIPRSCGGVEGSAIYIDTKSGFTPSRLADMAAACAEHSRAVYSRPVDVDAVLRGVSYVLAQDVTQLMAALHLAHRQLQAGSKVKLVVVDSVTFPFQHSAANSLSKTRLLSVAMDKLHRVASKHKVAVVVTNQLSTRVGPTQGESHLVPAQGESFAHRVNQRLLLGRLPSGAHAAVLFKSVSQPCMSPTFQILADGIRDFTSPN